MVITTPYRKKKKQSSDLAVKFSPIYIRTWPPTTTHAPRNPTAITNTDALLFFLRVYNLAAIALYAAAAALFSLSAACAAATVATGTRKGEHDT